MSDFSDFVHDICEQDYTSHFTTDDIFPTRENLIKWVRGLLIILDLLLLF